MSCSKLMSPSYVRLQPAKSPCPLWLPSMEVHFTMMAKHVRVLARLGLVTRRASSFWYFPGQGWA